MRERAVGKTPGTRQIGWLLAFFLLALLPRLSTVLARTAFADDLIHTPQGHLLSHRFTNFVELGWWTTIFGDRYLIGATPKIIASIYTAFLCLAIRALLLRWRVSPLAATLVAILIPLHPIWNAFIVWNVCGVYVLSLLLLVLGYTALVHETPRHRIAGVLLLVAGIGSYQIHIGLLPAMIALELFFAPVRSWRIVARRVTAVVIAIALYAIASKALDLAGLHTWGSRGVSLTRFTKKLQPMFDNIATLTQPLLSYFGSIEIAWRFWWLPFLAIAAFAGIVIAILDRRPLRALVVAIGVVALPIIAASVILPLNVQPTGPRVSAAIWLSLLLALVPLLDRVFALRARMEMLALVALLGTLACIVAVADARNRARAWEYDLDVLNAIREDWTSRGVPIDSVTIEIHRPPLPAGAIDDGRPIVLQNFKEMTPRDYSNVIRWPHFFFPAFGFHVRTTSSDALPGDLNYETFAAWKSDAATRTTIVIARSLDPAPSQSPRARSPLPSH